MTKCFLPGVSPPRCIIDAAPLDPRVERDAEAAAAVVVVLGIGRGRDSTGRWKGRRVHEPLASYTSAVWQQGNSMDPRHACPLPHDDMDEVGRQIEESVVGKMGGVGSMDGQATVPLPLQDLGLTLGPPTQILRSRQTPTPATLHARWKPGNRGVHRLHRRNVPIPVVEATSACIAHSLSKNGRNATWHLPRATTLNIARPLY